MKRRRCPICARAFGEEERVCPEHALPLVEPRVAGGEGELAGHVLDQRYLLGRLAGKGGMGVVYEAENLRTGRRVAVKVLLPELHADPKMRIRLFREVQGTSRIRHPNVVEIYDYGEDARAGTYLVMEYLDGRSLASLIREHGQLPIEFVVKAGVQLASALAETHSHGLIHRDLKPSNVRLLVNGTVKVLDFGLVKAFEAGKGQEFATLTTGGIAFGTPWYMSPEQASFQPLDPRSDIYSLGIVFYELLAGQPPFVGDNPLDLIEAQRHKPVPLPSQLDPPVQLPASIELLVLKMLAKAPAERHQSMTEVLEDLFAVAREQGFGLAELTPRLPGESTLAAPPADDDDDVEQTQPVTTEFWPPASQPTVDFREIIALNFEDLAEQIADGMCAVIPRYRTIPRQLVIGGVKTVLRAGAEAVSPEPSLEIPADLRQMADDRAEGQFTITEMIGALLIGLTAARPLLREAADGKLERYIALHDEFDRRVIPFYLRLIDFYYTLYSRRMIRLNEMLTRQNEELQQLREQLAQQLRTTTSQLAGLERLKARVTESITSGLLLFERGSRKIMLFNRAMERITGLGANDVLDRRLDDVLHFVEGVPYAEFVEQIRLHGEVGLRKLRLRLPGGTEKAVYVRGQAFTDADGKESGTLFVVDDVTEREQIIESFSRYVSRDVVERVLRWRGTVRPSGETRRAVLMACGIREFRSLVKGLSAEGVTELLTDYIRTVGDAVFHHGGVIDSVVGDAILVYFTPQQDATVGPAIEAAGELVRRLAQLNTAREAEGLPELLVGVGLHIGEVMVLNVGSERRMVHTVLGEAAQVAGALQDVASGGEVLISSAIRAAAGDEVEVESGPVVGIKGREAVEAHRLTMPAAPDASPQT